MQPKKRGLPAFWAIKHYQTSLKILNRGQSLDSRRRGFLRLIDYLITIPIQCWLKILTHLSEQAGSKLMIKIQNHRVDTFIKEVYNVKHFYCKILSEFFSNTGI
jgi:hypothetical protein